MNKEYGQTFTYRREAISLTENTTSLTLYAGTPYAKDGSIIFMSDKANEHLKQQPQEMGKSPVQNTTPLSAKEAMQNFQEKFGDWQSRYPDEVDNTSTAHTMDIMKSMGIPVDNVFKNAQLTDEERLQKAEDILTDMGELPLTQDQKAMLINSHNFASGMIGKDGREAGVYNYTLPQLLGKARMMNDDGGFNAVQRRALMEAGITGAPGGGDGGEPGGDYFAGRDYSGATFGGAEERPEGTPTSTSAEEALAELARQNARDAGVEHTQRQEQNIKQRLEAANNPEAVRKIIGESVMQQVNRIANKIVSLEAKTPGQLEQGVGRFSEDYQHRLELALDSLITPEDVAAAKLVANQVLTEVFQRERDEYWAQYDPASETSASKRKEGQMNDMVDVAESIMQTDPGKWGTKEFNIANKNLNGGEAGEFPLLFEDGPDKGKVNQPNFIKWVREKMVEQHNYDPDSPVNFFTQVSVENPNVYRTVNLQTMTQNFGIYFRDKGGALLKDLRDEVINLAWLGGQVRNMDVQYRQEMSNDQRFAEMLTGLFKGNTFGKEDTKGVNTLASLFTMDEEYAVVGPDGKKKQGDMKLGSAMRSSYLMYYHLTDPEKLRQLFTNDFTLYNKDEMKAAITKARGDAPEDEFLKEAKLDKFKNLLGDGQDGDIWDFYDVNGVVKEDQLGKFSTLIDVFSPPTKNRTQIDIFRKLITGVAAKQSGLMKNGEVDYVNAAFPELMGYLMTYWSGAASRQDIGFAALNAFTKAEHFKGYLYKQAHPSRAGGVGNVRQIELLKKLTVDPMVGILTTSGKTTLELLEDMQRVSNKQVDGNYSEEMKRAELEKIKRTWSYEDRAWSQYAPQHVGNGFKEFHDRTAGKQVKFESFVHYEMSTGRVTYDTDKMISEVQESIIKPTRYRLSTHKLDYSFEQRTLQVKGAHPHKKTFLENFYYSPHHDDKKGDKDPEYKTETVAEAMFGAQVLLTTQEIMKHENHDIKTFLNSKGEVLRDADGKITADAKKALESSDFGRVVAKSYLICKFATMLYYNTTRTGSGHLMDISTRELVIRGIGSVTAGVAGDADDFRNTEITKKYFTNFDLQLMRKMAKNERWRNTTRQASSDVASGFFKGMVESIGMLGKELKPK